MSTGIPLASLIDDSRDLLLLIRQGAQNIQEMGRSHIQQSGSLLLVGLFLVILANLGLTIHTGHHSLAAGQSGTATQSLAGHTGPTLHLDSLSEVRTMSCPGCLLQQQVSGGHLLSLQSLDRPAVAARDTRPLLESPIPRFISTTLTRGPPSVDQI